MKWNWQDSNWPSFKWDSVQIHRAEAIFLENCGKIAGASLHLNEEEKQCLFIDILTQEASDTSEIEGEYLNRFSVQSSIKKSLGLKVDKFRASSVGLGISEMMTDLYKNISLPLSEKMIFKWHKMLMNGRKDLDNLGSYRTHREPMQIVSGPDYARKIHYEAPPSENIVDEMKKFIFWYKNDVNKLSIGQSAPNFQK